MGSSSSDVIVIGAGAAGLIAAAELAQAGRDVVLLEARDRVGGRIWTRREADLPVPIELGAEFIHGHAAITRTLLAKAGLSAIESSDSHWTLRQGAVQTRDAGFPQIIEAMSNTDVLRKQDMSFDRFLDEHLGRVLTPQARQLARMMAEGFDAADTARASARALVAEWTGDILGNTPQSRPAQGYASLLAAILGSLPAERLRLRLQSRVHSVRWSKGSVEVAGEFAAAPFALRASRAIIALPIGVLQCPPGEAGAVRFLPPLEEKHDALRGLVSGPVIKVLLRFASSFWEDLHHGRYRNASFFHSPDAPVPTFWTPAPSRAPLLVAWAGGPRALRLAANAAPADIARLALASVQVLFGTNIDVAEQFAGYYFHDWQQDPLARGAYSYVTVDGAQSRETLARPIEDTLFFAGEATDTEGEGGTVTGALQSGVRAAREALGM